MRIGQLALLLLFISVLLPGSPAGSGARAEEPTVIIVTSPADALDDPDAVCPDVDRCTLRRAIELANGLGEAAIATTLIFDTSVFDHLSPVTIALVAPLPAIAHPGIEIDASEAGVLISGAGVGENPVPGLRLQSDAQVVTGLYLQSFFGPCIQVNGGGVTVESVTVGGCAIGIDVRGMGTTITSSRVGFAPGGSAASNAIGIRVLASGTVIGTRNGEPAGNVIGNGADGIRVGGGATTADGTVIRHNWIDSTSDGAPAPLTNGIIVQPPATGSSVEQNDFANIAGAAITVDGSTGPDHATGHQVRGNTMATIGGLGIDLGGDGVRNTSKVPPGPNDWIRPPVIEKVLPGRVTGVACSGCEVDLYVAAHRPGGARDYGTSQFATVTASAGGEFGYDFPPLSPGDWVVATATDGDGNTSEFSAPAITGTGHVTCGATALPEGWSHRGFFGGNGTPLGTMFPASGPDAGKVTAIYRLVDGTATYQRWIAGEPAFSTLTALEPGEAYFFLVTAPLSLPGGFTLAVPYILPLADGWNDIVYIGQRGHFRDALAVDGALDGVFRFDDGWQVAHTGTLPAWARDFEIVEACTSYVLQVDGATTLIPLQP